MVGKIQFSVSDISIERLKKEDREDLLNFSCGVDKKENKLNGFFHSDDLFLCDKHHFCSVYIVRQKSTSSLLAVFTLANDSIGLLSQDDKKELRHLGVSSQFHSAGIGSILIKLILKTFADYNVSGCQFVTVDSLNNPRTNNFYLKNGFSNLSNSDSTALTRRMYIQLDSIRG